jgi:predicted GIY-YIG superfamily endonuclease
MYLLLMSSNADCYCYLLCTDSGQTYVGATIDPDRRLRQHNKEISGGARATGIKVAQGQLWKRVCYISGIPEWRSALQIEWRWKQLSRTAFKSIRNPIERRLKALKRLLELEKPTEAAIPYEAYPSGSPQIIWDLKNYEDIYLDL